MKFFAFIMACVILIVSAAPCADAKAFGVKQSSVIVKAAQQNNSIPHADTCSPLCICSCCAGFSLYYSYPQLLKSIYHLSSVNDAFILADTHQVALPVWQPPRL